MNVVFAAPVHHFCVRWFQRTWQ